MYKFLIILSIIATNAQAETKYNPYTRSYEPVQSASQPVQPRYNPYTRGYEMTTRDSQLVYNPYNTSYTYVPKPAKKP